MNYQIQPIPLLSYLLSEELTLPESKDQITNYYVNYQANRILQPTDWYVVRRSDNNTPIPLDWDNWRQTIRDEAATKTTTINACTSKEELTTYCNSTAFLTWSPDPNTST